MNESLYFPISQAYRVGCECLTIYHQVSVIGVINEIVVQGWTDCLHAGQRAPSIVRTPYPYPSGPRGKRTDLIRRSGSRRKEMETENWLSQAVHQAIEVTQDRVDAKSFFHIILDSHDVDGGAEHYPGNSDSRESPRVSGLITFHERRLRPSDPRRSFATHHITKTAVALCNTKSHICLPDTQIPVATISIARRASVTTLENRCTRLQYLFDYPFRG